MPSREEKEAPMEEKKGNLSGGMQTYFEVGCVPDMLSLVPQPYRSQVCIYTVSYTHLRAHETDQYL
eukprot:1392069-Amorphochlora_amoeboformis.AAC.1